MHTRMHTEPGGDKHPATERKPKIKAFYQVTTEGECAGCYEATHPLYGCGQFKVMSHEKRLAKVRKHNLCLHELPSLA